MQPIKYVGEDESTAGWKDNKSKWANAITSDGSMWVWIPRYAYKIKYKSVNADGTPNRSEGTIAVAFINIKNEFLNGESGNITTNPSEVTYTNGMFLSHMVQEIVVKLKQCV